MNGRAWLLVALTACLGTYWLLREDLVTLDPRLAESGGDSSNDGFAAGHSVRHAPAVREKDIDVTDVAVPAAATSNPGAVTVSFGQDHAGQANTVQDDLAPIKTTFAEQHGDSAWTARIDDAVRRAVSSTAAFNGVVSDFVECRETICKLVLGYSDPPVFDEFVSELTVNLKGDLSASLYFDEHRSVGGNSRVEVYLIRE